MNEGPENRQTEVKLHPLGAAPVRFLKNIFRGETKGSLLKGIFDKACALTCRSLRRSPTTPHPPHPLPLFSFFSHRKNHPPPPTRLNPTSNHISDVFMFFGSGAWRREEGGRGRFLIENRGRGEGVFEEERGGAQVLQGCPQGRGREGAKLCENYPR